MVEALQPELAVFGTKHSLAVNLTSLKIKGHELIFLILEHSCILHHYDVEWIEVISFNGVNAIDPCEEGLVLSTLDMLYVIV